MEIIQQYFSDFTPKQTEQLSGLKDLYTEWNEKINVISRKDMDNFYLHHVLHSLTIATQFELGKDMQVMDLGCGGGFPGVPLAIFFPDAQFHMVDSINKKLTVIKEIAAAIGLDNITTRHSRAEDIKDRQFDTVVSRAVAPLKDLWRWSKPLIKKNRNRPEGQPNGLICLKGGDLTSEIFESGCKPFVWDIYQLFPEDHFKEKFMLYQPKLYMPELKHRIIMLLSSKKPSELATAEGRETLADEIKEEANDVLGYAPNPKKKNKRSRPEDDGPVLAVLFNQFIVQ